MMMPEGFDRANRISRGIEEYFPFTDNFNEDLLEDSVIMKDKCKDMNYLIEFSFEEFAKQENFNYIKKYIKDRKKGDYNNSHAELFDILKESIVRMKVWRDQKKMRSLNVGQGCFH